MILRYDVAYTVHRIEALRISLEVSSSDADPGDTGRQSGRTARAASADLPALARRDAGCRTIEWRDRP